jgi:hypothetical protein
MSIKKTIIIPFFIILSLTGCVSTSEKISIDTGDFFSQKPTNSNAIVFFTCGKTSSKTFIGDFHMDSLYCNFRVNSVLYTRLKKGTVGKLSLAPGEYSLDQGGNTGNHTQTVIKVNSGEMLLATANYITTPGGITATMLWKIGVSKNINAVVNKTPISMKKK